MTNDEDLLRRIERLSFDDEPPMLSGVQDDVARGQRRLRRQRLTWGTGVFGITAMLAASVVANPFGNLMPDTDADVPVAGPGRNELPSQRPTPTTEPPQRRIPDDGLEFPNTRELLLAKAIEHLDPDAEHLPDELSGFTGSTGGEHAEVGTKLAWTVPGEDGTGMILPVVTTPGFSAEDLQITEEIGCLPMSTCERVNPDEGGTAWISDESKQTWGVLYERPDGSLVGLQVTDLFGNNSTTAVSKVDITPEQALAFVTDPDLRVDPDEIGDQPD